MRLRLLVPLLLVLLAGCGHRANKQGAKASEDRTAWRKLAKGMTPDEVRAILGQPLRVEEQGEAICWYYQQGEPLHRNAEAPDQWVIPRGALLFSAKAPDGPKLAEWREP
jgi:outer membrane protein assembly factor BamE (lipoprotein component of BamABCDE complex)